MKKFQSISTPGLVHSGFQATVEIYMYLKYETLPHYPWKEGLHKEWKEAITVIKRVHKVKGVDHLDLLPYILNVPTLELTFKKIGLLFWYLDNKKYNPVNLDHYIDHILKTNPPKVKQEVDVPKVVKLKKPKNIKAIFKKG
jgi:hypothetical protein